MNKNTIIVILVVIIIAIGAFFVVGQSNGKMNTQIKIINNETFQNGEQLQFELKDAQGKALSGQKVNISFNNQKFSITTDQNGKGHINITGVSAGKYDVEVTYAGNDKYNGCTAKESITITDDVADNPVTTSNGSNSNNNSNNSSDQYPGCHYDGQYEFWVRDSDNMIVSGPYAGMNFDDWYVKYGPGSPDVPVNDTN